MQMQLIIMVAVYIAQNLLAIVLIDRCLNRWTFTAERAKRLRKY